MTIADKLISELTQEDAKRDARERKRYGRSNPYAIAIEIGAAREAELDVLAGETWEAAFANHFNPTRSNHNIARRLGFQLDVDRGAWITKGG